MKLSHPMTAIPLAILVLLIALLINNMIRNAPQQPVTITETVTEEEADAHTGQPNPMAEIDINILQEGADGLEAQDGDTLSVHYTGTLEDGTEFDSSRDRGPFSVTLGQNRVIQGWEFGLQGVKVGEQRQLTIPAELGYGARAVGSIPANSTLIFDIEVLSIERPE